MRHRSIAVVTLLFVFLLVSCEAAAKPKNPTVGNIPGSSTGAYSTLKCDPNKSAEVNKCGSVCSRNAIAVCSKKKSVCCCAAREPTQCA